MKSFLQKTGVVLLTALGLAVFMVFVLPWTINSIRWLEAQSGEQWNLACRVFGLSP